MTPHPVNKFGDRNYQCRLYEKCHNHTFKNNWTFWSCSDCEHKLLGTAVTFVGRGTKSTSVPKYGKFQLVSKERVRHFLPPSKKNLIPNPSPFRFFRP